MQTSDDILSPDEIRELVEKTGELFREAHRPILVRLARAIVQVESGGEIPDARTERTYRWLCKNPKGVPRKCSAETEEDLQKISWGLMQVMGATARELGFCGWLTKLLEPATNLFWGMKYLQQLGIRYGWNERDMIAAYNQGSNRKNKDGTYKNQRYVDDVNDQLQELAAE